MYQISGISIIFTTDDCPQGHWENRKLPTKTLVIEMDVNQTSSENKMEGVPNLGFDDNTHKIVNGVDYYIPQGMKLDCRNIFTNLIFYLRYCC